MVSLLASSQVPPTCFSLSQEPLPQRAGTKRCGGSSLPLRVRCSQTESSSEAVTSTETPTKAASSTSPFAGKKISSLLAARKTQTQETSARIPPSSPPSPDVQAPQAPTLSPTLTSLLRDSTATAGASSSTQPPSKPVSPVAAASTSRPSSVNAVPAGTARAKVSFGKKSVIDALKADGGALKGGASLKAGSPGAPANIFVDPVRSKEQIEAEKFRFEINKGQILLAVSFFASSLIMMGTVYIVWKLGAIHYNEL